MQAIPEDAVQEDSGDEEEDDPNKRISSKTLFHRHNFLTYSHRVSGDYAAIHFKLVFHVLIEPSALLTSVRAHDKRIACEEEFSDSEDEGEGGRRNAASFKKAKRAKTDGEKEGEEKEKKTEEETKGIHTKIYVYSFDLIGQIILYNS